jgi:hypothetical protein
MDARLSPLRELRTTASQAPLIINGSPQEIYELWQERIGERPPPDLTDNLPVQLGKHNEPFIIDWLERHTHRISERQRFIEHPTRPKIGCTLDGYREHDDAVVEVKFIGMWRRRLEFLPWYTPQVLVQMRCRGAAHGILAVLQGNAKIEEYDILLDRQYEDEVWGRLEAFQHCVDTLTPPVSFPPLVPPEKWRTIDLTEQPMPNWGGEMIDALRLWSETKDAAAAHTDSKEHVKALLPDDIGKVLYGPLSVNRAKNNAVTIKQREHRQ